MVWAAQCGMCACAFGRVPHRATNREGRVLHGLGGGVRFVPDDPSVEFPHATADRVRTNEIVWAAARGLCHRRLRRNPSWCHEKHEWRLKV
eukprot:2889593-Pyramimonas_sp.AAC.1